METTVFRTYINKLCSIQMSYYEAILTSAITVITVGGVTLQLQPSSRVLLKQDGEQYTVRGYFTLEYELVLTQLMPPQPISVNQFQQDGMIPFNEESPIPEAPDPQGPNGPEPVTEPEGLYRFRNIHLRL